MPKWGGYKTRGSPSPNQSFGSALTMFRIVLLTGLVLVGLREAQSAATTPATTCGNNPADIVFLLDSSGSVGASNFQKQLDFVKRFAQTFDIGPSNVQIGAVTFASTPHNEFNLNTFSNKHDLLAGINKIGYHSGGTRTDLALQYVEANSFKPQSGDRPGVANILIVMTDGGSNMPDLTTKETVKLHQMNLKVFSIGIGSGVNKAELGRIATDAQHVFQVQNFDALNTLQAELKKTACEIDGGWTKWGSYSPCTKSCGGGTQYRERSCTNPRPANGGAQCTGNARENHNCNTAACPTTPPPTTTTTPKTTPIPTTLAVGCNGTEPADIVFILDASGSVGAPNFQKTLDFVNKMVDGFPIGPTETHVGLITFDSKTYLQFHLNKYTDKARIKAAVSATRYTSGTTHTAEAIKYAREVSFTKANGLRPNAAKIAIIVTDGQSANAAATASEANLLRQAGITVFSIGVGSGAKVSELNAMATDPDKTHVFQVTDFSSLNTIKATLQQKTCEVKATTVPPTTPPPKPVCDVQADIVFLLDSSGSVGSSNFAKTKDFVKDVANNFNIGPNAVQIGVDTFQSSVKSEFNMNKYANKNQMLAAINGIQYRSGSTHTGEAIRFMRTDSFTAAAGDRPNIPNLAIVVTDGNSNNAALTKSEAEKLRQAGTTVLAIGVGNGISKTELNAIATDPDSTHVFTADNFDALKTLKALLQTKACEVSKPSQNVTSPTKQCAAKADIVFILDSSGSIGQSNYDKMLTFVKDVSSNFEVGQDKIRVGLEIFSDRTFPQFNLNKYYTTSAISTAISNIPYKRGTTNTAQSLKDAYNQMFTQTNGDRPGVPNIAIVVTDGRSNNRPNTLSEAKKLRDSGVQVFAVGVGSGVDKSELNGIASDPDSTHVLTVADFSQLRQITASLQNSACDASTNVTQTGTGVVGPTIVSVNDPCRDQNANCGNYDIPAICLDYAAWAKDNCNRSCGFCTPSIPTTPPPCTNHISDCASYDPTVCTQYRGWAEDNCRQFCGFCSLGQTTQVLTGFFGKCYYNGKQYNQGDTWDDGCAYECTCDDAASGRYSCYNKCPLYHNLPPQCTLIKQNPTECCLAPVCNFEGTHLTNNGQNSGTFNGNKVCMYKGAPYYQGQTWQDGCEFSCICADAQTGRYSCQSVCATYTNLPNGCTLIKPPGKCCEEPSCTFNKQYGQFTGSGTSSGKGTGATTMTTPPPCVDKDANCARYPQDSCTDPTYRAWAMDQCPKRCNLCNLTPTPGPNDVCIYKGVKYQQGQRWQDGCELECICENAMYGYYRCNKKCADVVNLPLGCSQVKQAGQCCPTVQCTGTSGVFTGSQTVPGTIGGNAVAPPQYPTPAPGQTLAPGLTPAPGQVITGALNGCFYKGALYQQGDRWSDGCTYTCVCESGNTGQYKCSPKCPVFNNLPSECQMMDNPNDPCCQQPVCTPGPSGTLSVVPIPTYGKGFTGYGRPVMPSIGTGTGSGFTGNSGVPTAITGTGTGCVYGGKVYTQGQVWDDGCKYRCTCVDAVNRQYQCTDRCVLYQNLPPQCHLEQDPNDNCCQTPKCDFTKPVTTIAPLFALTTPSSGAAFCQYQGYYHRQGEVWNDGCGLTCRCEDAANHYYQCTDRCPKYNNVPSSCTFVPDPKDPQCCSVPSCQGAAGTGIAGSGTQGFTGSFVGYGKPSSINSNTLSKTGYANACLYKGQIYQQADTWQDGCDYECECTDASAGRYVCTERCQRIANVPSGCSFTTDPSDACCQVLKCDPQALACSDAINNCASYGSYVCTQYKDWASTNCPKYCSFCGAGSQQTSGTSAPGTCTDGIPNCAEYGSDPCVKAEFQSWALVNCKKTCNLCNVGTGGTGTGSTGTGMTGTGGTGTGGTGTGMTGTGMTGTGMTGSGTCSDVLTNCQEYGKSSCVAPYLDWARKNCPYYCGLCGSGNGTSGGISGFQTVAPGGSSFTGFSGGCVYKGRYYPMGDKWQDGCDFNCTCENGQTGFFRCIPRCPNYQLAAGCVLRKNPGECCGVPDCSGATGTGGTGTGTGGTGTGGTGTGTGGTGTGGTSTMTGDQPGCAYNNVIYQQGQQWKDGCKYTCTCINAATHQYSCAPICVTWNLPNVCTLNPPATGKCCQTPNCPANVVINYPPGYTEQ